jgi:hypothetical protein
MAKKKGKINWIKTLSVTAFLFIIFDFFVGTRWKLVSSPFEFSLEMTPGIFLAFGVLLISIIVLIKAFGK